MGLWLDNSEYRSPPPHRRTVPWIACWKANATVETHLAGLVNRIHNPAAAIANRPHPTNFKAVSSLDTYRIINCRSRQVHDRFPSFSTSFSPLAMTAEVQCRLKTPSHPALQNPVTALRLKVVLMLGPG
jgi:hypothetical protein